LVEVGTRALIQKRGAQIFSRQREILTGYGIKKFSSYLTGSLKKPDALPLSPFLKNKKTFDHALRGRLFELDPSARGNALFKVTVLSHLSFYWLPARQPLFLHLKF